MRREKVQMPVLAPAGLAACWEPPRSFGLCFHLQDRGSPNASQFPVFRYRAFGLSSEGPSSPGESLQRLLDREEKPLSPAGVVSIFGGLCPWDATHRGVGAAALPPALGQSSKPGCAQYPEAPD